MSDSIKQLLAISLLGVLLMAGCSQPTANVTNRETTPVVNNNALQTPEQTRNSESTNTEASTMVNSEKPTESEVKVTYNNGTFEGEGSYMSPAGEELVKVSMVLENGLVKSMDLNVDTENNTSKKFKGLFKAGIDELVIGKSLDEIQGFAQVNGSSLTPKGFQQAVEAIKAESKA
ncbi:MAG: hypothetical protein ACRCZE_02875 [Candidatus Altimarinota bacterium]